MSLWFSSLLLVSGLFLSVSALTPEECKPLITPLSLDDHSVFSGRVNFITGYTDNDLYNNILKTTSSNWMNFTSSDDEVSMYEENNIRPHQNVQLHLYADDPLFYLNGTCFGSTFKISIEGDIATVSAGNMSSTLHLLPTCDGCMLLSGNSSSKGLDKVLQALNIHAEVPEEEFVAHGLYLMAKDTTVKDSDLEHFKKQASCLGFSGEPNFHYDPERGFCKEDEVKKVEL